MKEELIKEELVTYKIATLAKEKGFKSISNYYDGAHELILNPTHTNNMMQRFRYEAPTQSLLQSWLRKKHNIVIIINVEANYSELGVLIDSFNYVIYELKSKITLSDNNFNSYEQALETAIKEALDLIKKIT